MSTCKQCGIQYDKKQVSRTYGKESSVYLLGYCSSKCYTDATVKKINLIDKILKEGFPNKYDNLSLLTEVKLNRILDYHFKNGFIIISANRGDNDSATNKLLTKKLLGDIIASKHSYIPVYGGFIENKGTNEEKEVQ